MLDDEMIEQLEETLREDPHAFTDILSFLKGMAEMYVSFQEDNDDQELARGFKRVEGVLEVAHLKVKEILGTKGR